MSIEHGKVRYRNLWIQIQIVNHLICVLHRLSLPNILRNADIEPLKLKFKRSNLEIIARNHRLVQLRWQSLEDGCLFCQGSHRDSTQIEVKVEFESAFAWKLRKLHVLGLKGRIFVQHRLPDFVAAAQHKFFAVESQSLALHAVRGFEFEQNGVKALIDCDYLRSLTLEGI